MKKIITLIAAIGFAFSGMAQDGANDKNFRFGLHVDPSFNGLPQMIRRSFRMENEIWNRGWCCDGFQIRREYLVFYWSEFGLYRS